MELSEKEAVVRQELKRLLVSHSLPETGSVFGADDEIVLSYVLGVLECLAPGDDLDEAEDVYPFADTMEAYLPGFSAVRLHDVGDWMVSTAVKLSQPLQHTDVNGTSSQREDKDVSSSSPGDASDGTVHINTTGSLSPQQFSLKDIFAPQSQKRVSTEHTLAPQSQKQEFTMKDLFAPLSPKQLINTKDTFATQSQKHYTKHTFALKSQKPINTKHTSPPQSQRQPKTKHPFTPQSLTQRINSKHSLAPQPETLPKPSSPGAEACGEKGMDGVPGSDTDSMSALRELCPAAITAELRHCLHMSQGNVEEAAHLLLSRQEAGSAITKTAEVKACKKNSKTGRGIHNDESLKDSILAKYSFVDTSEDKTEHRPELFVKDQKKMIRYREGQVVSTKGERFSEIKKPEGDDMKKTYVSLKPQRKYRFH